MQLQSFLLLSCRSSYLDASVSGTHCFSLCNFFQMGCQSLLICIQNYLKCSIFFKDAQPRHSNVGRSIADEEEMSNHQTSSFASHDPLFSLSILNHTVCSFCLSYSPLQVIGPMFRVVCWLVWVCCFLFHDQESRDASQMLCWSSATLCPPGDQEMLSYLNRQVFPWIIVYHSRRRKVDQSEQTFKSINNLKHKCISEYLFYLLNVYL